MNDTNRKFADNPAYVAGLAAVVLAAWPELMLALLNLVQLIRYKLVATGLKILLFMTVLCGALSTARIGIEFSTYLILIGIGEFSLVEVHNVMLCQVLGSVTALPATISTLVIVPLTYYQWRQVKKLDTENSENNVFAIRNQPKMKGKTARRHFRSGAAVVIIGIVLVVTAAVVPPVAESLPMCDLIFTVQPHMGVIFSAISLIIQLTALALAVRSRNESRMQMRAYEARNNDLTVAQRVLIARNGKLFKALYPGIVAESLGYLSAILMYLFLELIIPNDAKYMENRSIYNLFLSYVPFRLGNLAMGIFLRRMFRQEPTMVEPSMAEGEQQFRLNKLNETWNQAANAQR